MATHARAAALSVALTVMLLLTGCSTGAILSVKVTPSPVAARSAPTAVASPDGPRAAPREAVSPDPNFDYGFVVQITPGGFHPQWLVSACCLPVTWKNLTDSTASVVFDHQLVNSGPIPPGGTFVFTPHNVQSIAYHSANDTSTIGVLQVNQTFES
jgi:hypothetical protein